MEIWDILNKNGEPTGKTAVRGQSQLSNGEYHLVVHIWPIDKKGRLLIQKRADTVRLMPGEWAATSGSAISGEDSETAARRELREELGITEKDGQIKFFTRLKRRNSFLDIWTIRVNKRAEDFILQKEEVADVKWVTVETLKRMVEDGEFHHYGGLYFDTVYSAARKNGNIFRRIKYGKNH